MAQQHIHKLGEAKIGDTVQVPVPEVDRGPGDLPHILACIVEINKTNFTYRLATKHGLLKGWASRNQFAICAQRLIDASSLELGKEYSIRELNGFNSISGKQGFLKCQCGGTCTRNCTCKKAGVFCNSKCHKSNAHSKCENCQK